MRGRNTAPYSDAISLLEENWHGVGLPDEVVLVISELFRRTKKEVIEDWNTKKITQNAYTEAMRKETIKRIK